MDARVNCSARGHDRHVFGDITDTLGAGQVDGCDLMGAEEDAVLTIGRKGPDSDTFATEGSRNDPAAALETDVVLGGRDGAHNLMVVVLDLRQARRQGAHA